MDLQDYVYKPGEKGSGNDPLMDCDGLMSWVSENVAKPFANAAFIEPCNAVSSSVNDLSGQFGSGKMLPECQPLELQEAEEGSFASAGQSVATGLGSIVPYCVAVLATKGRLKALAGQSTTPMAHLLRHQTTSMVLGAATYDVMKKPREGETRLGNGLGSAAAMLTFEGGNHLSRNMLLMDKLSARALTGAAGSSLHLTVSGLVSKGELPDSQAVDQAVFAGAAFNVIFPTVMERFSAAKTKGPSTTSLADVSENTATASAPETAIASKRMRSQHQHPVGYVLSSDEVTLMDYARRIDGREGKATAPLHTSQLLSDDVLIDFHRQVTKSVRTFRHSEEFPQVQESFKGLVEAKRAHSRQTADFLDMLNKDRPLESQISRGELSNKAKLESLADQHPEMRSAMERWHESRAHIAELSKDFSKVKARQITADLKSAVGYLSDELSMPPLGLRIASLTRSTKAGTSGNGTHAFYDGGKGVEVMNAGTIFSGKCSDVTALLGHETGHGYQEYIMARHIADTIRIGKDVSPAEVTLFQKTCGQVGDFFPSEKWSRAMLAMRNGLRLPDAKAEHAVKLLVDIGERGEANKTQIALKAMDNFLSNPNLPKPVTTVLTQLENPTVRALYFPDGKLPDTIVRLQGKLQTGTPVDSWLQKADFRDCFKSSWRDQEAARYLRYRNAYYEQDMWNFEERIRALTSSPRSGR